MWGCDWKLPSPHSILNLPASALSHVSEKRALLVQDSARLHSPSPRQVTLISREELFLAEARGVSPAHALRSFLRRRPWDITGWSPSGCPAGAVGLLTLPLRFGVGPLMCFTHGSKWGDLGLLMLLMISREWCDLQHQTVETTRMYSNW